MKIIHLPENLREQLGKTTATELVELFNNSFNNDRMFETADNNGFERKLYKLKFDIIQCMFISMVSQIVIMIVLLS